MQLSHAITRLENAVAAQMRVASPELETVAEQLMTALEPAIKQTLLEVAEAAAVEIGSQLTSQTVEIRLVSGEPELIVKDNPGAIPPPPEPPHPGEDDAEARITLRLPGYLKDLVNQAAEESGDSVNAWVVQTLTGKAHTKSNKRVRRTIEL